MSKICKITGKKPMSGNNRSHSMNATKRKFLPNLQSHRFWISKEKKFIKLKISTKAIRLIDKKGIQFFLNKNKKI
ncbi:50S ribosomal protein L28 [Buchnera aphidicola (Mindarus keteleerifoliae)]|uniref:50S ribosomal protein L28 n=1 Tax=Buchnera aphidicola TaxID=9 RepID=UPI0031B73CE2